MIPILLFMIDLCIPNFLWYQTGMKSFSCSICIDYEVSSFMPIECLPVLRYRVLHQLNACQFWGTEFYTNWMLASFEVQSFLPIECLPVLRYRVLHQLNACQFWGTEFFLPIECLPVLRYRVLHQLNACQFWGTEFFLPIECLPVLRYRVFLPIECLPVLGASDTKVIRFLETLTLKIAFIFNNWKYDSTGEGNHYPGIHIGLWHQSSWSTLVEVEPMTQFSVYTQSELLM